MILLKNSTRIVIDYLSNTDKSIKIVTPQKNNKFNELKKKHDKGYYITVSVYDNNRNLIKYFKQ